MVLRAQEILELVQGARVRTLKARLPDQVSQRLKILAQLEGIPVQNFIGIIIAGSVAKLWNETMSREMKKGEE